MARHRWDPIAPRVQVVPPRRVGAGLTPDQARGRRWRRTGAGLHVPAEVDGNLPEQRAVEVAARAPAHAVLTGWAACRLHRAAWFDGYAADGRTQLPVQMAVGPRGAMRRTPGVALSFEQLPEWETWTRYGIRVARPERAVFDEMRRWDEREALMVLESALAGRITSVPRMRAFAAGHRRARRMSVVAWALSQARGHARSPLEVRVRTIAEEDAGWGRCEVNRVVEGVDGARVGEVDIIDVDAGTVLEVDGADHRAAVQQTWDITKEEHLRARGLEVTRVTFAHTREPAVLARRLQAVRTRALASPRAATWRLRPRAFDVEEWLSEQEARSWWAEAIHGQATA